VARAGRPGDIARAFGIANLVRAHAGGDLAALPRAFVTAAARLGWDDWCARRTLHFLSDTFDPAPWVALALATAGGVLPSGATLSSLAALPLATLSLPENPEFDRLIVEDGLRAMCLASAKVAGSFRTRSRLPDGAITIDTVACAVVAPSRGELDPVVPALLAAAGGRRAHGRTRPHRYELHLGSITAIREAAAAICEASPGLACDDFALVPRANLNKRSLWSGIGQSAPCRLCMLSDSDASWIAATMPEASARGPVRLCG